MLKVDEIKLAIDDVRARHAALVQLVFFVEQQALGLLRTYVPVGIASATAASVGLSGQTSIPWVTAVSLLLVTLCLLAGCVFCFLAMRQCDLGLPGKGAEFWLYSLEDEDLNLHHAAAEYMKQTKLKMDRDRKHNEEASNWNNRAKTCGAFALLLALLSGCLTLMPKSYLGFLGV